MKKLLLGLSIISFLTGCGGGGNDSVKPTISTTPVVTDSTDKEIEIVNPETSTFFKIEDEITKNFINPVTELGTLKTNSDDSFANELENDVRESAGIVLYFHEKVRTMINHDGVSNENQAIDYVMREGKYSDSQYCLGDACVSNNGHTLTITKIEWPLMDNGFHFKSDTFDQYGDYFVTEKVVVANYNKNIYKQRQYKYTYTKSENENNIKMELETGSGKNTEISFDNHLLEYSKYTNTYHSIESVGSNVTLTKKHIDKRNVVLEDINITFNENDQLGERFNQKTGEKQQFSIQDKRLALQ